MAEREGVVISCHGQEPTRCQSPRLNFFWNTYYVPGTVLDAVYLIENQTFMTHMLMELNSSTKIDRL